LTQSTTIFCGQTVVLSGGPGTHGLIAISKRRRNGHFPVNAHTGLIESGNVVVLILR
jgi:hypothetical protein